MAKRRKTNNNAPNNSEIQLPEALIQHIQSYLNSQQAAQTTVLSKSWYNAWLTRPNLDFDQQNFAKRLPWDHLRRFSSAFLNFVNKAMKRYEDLNLKIESFRLFMDYDKAEELYLANDLIVKAVNMGASDLHIDSRGLDLPHEVFEAESLTRLTVIGCRINPLVGRKVCCSRLRFLTLVTTTVEEDTIWDLISRCPLMENVMLSGCCSSAGLSYITDSKALDFRNSLLEHGKQNVGSVVDSRGKVSEFCKLNSLFLDWLHLDNSFFKSFSCKFPHLESLTLHHCYYYEALQISSHSLKHIRLERNSVLRIEFDVPSIRKFTYDGKNIPSISFKSSSSNWVSDISISYLGSYRRASWFVELQKFLKKLSPSRISLRLPSFMVKRMECGIDYLKGVACLSKPMVENLMLVSHKSSVECPALLDSLFLSCCPKTISLTWFPDSLILEEGTNKLLKTFEELIQQVSNCFCIKQSMFYSCDLEDVNVEIRNNAIPKCPSWGSWKSRFESGRAPKYRSMPWKAWLDSPQTPEYRQYIGVSVNIVDQCCPCPAGVILPGK